MISININSSIQFILTDEGAEIFKKSIWRKGHTPIKSGEIITEQLWVFMSVFGEYMSMVGPQLIKDNIIFVDKDNINLEKALSNLN